MVLRRYRRVRGIIPLIEFLKLLSLFLGKVIPSGVPVSDTSLLVT